MNISFNNGYVGFRNSKKKHVDIKFSAHDAFLQ
jgi:hypothetical protein